MTAPARIAPVGVETVEDAFVALRARGMRLSSARRLVLGALFEAEGPASAAQLAGRLAMDLASVYRNLEVLERHGLVCHLHLGHGPGLYLLAGAEEHEYLYCESCARVTALHSRELDPLRDHIRALAGYEVRFGHFALVGTCDECARDARDEQP